MAGVELQAQAWPRDASGLHVGTIRAAASECAALGDLDCALFLVRKARQQGLTVNMSCLDPFFVSDKGSSGPASASTVEAQESRGEGRNEEASCRGEKAGISDAPRAAEPEAGESHKGPLTPSLPPFSPSKAPSATPPLFRSLSPSSSPSSSFSSSSPPPPPRWRRYQEKTKERHGLVLPVASLSLSDTPPLALKHKKLVPAPASSSRARHVAGDDEEDTASSWPLLGSFQEGAGRGWESLPTEILQRIAEPLGPKAVLRASGVCASWAASLYACTECLSLTWCQTEGVNDLLQSVLPKFKHVQALNLRRCSALADAGVAAVAASSPGLQSLLLCMSPRVTDHALLGLSAACLDLQVLDLSGCRGVTDVGVAAVGGGCFFLRELSLCGCPRAGTNKALQSLGSSCPGLEVLNLGWCDRVADQGVIALAKGCTGLRALDLCGCSQITDDAVVALAANCPDLQFLNLHCCRLLTDAAIDALTAAAVTAATQTAIISSPGLTPGRELPVFEKSFPSSVGGSGHRLSGLSSEQPWRPFSTPPTSSWGVFHTVLHQDLPQQKYGLTCLNLSGCLNLHHDSVQALCNISPKLHTCSRARSLNISGCMALLGVRCAC